MISRIYLQELDKLCKNELYYVVIDIIEDNTVNGNLYIDFPALLIRFVTDVSVFIVLGICLKCKVNILNQKYLSIRNLKDSILNKHNHLLIK